MKHSCYFLLNFVPALASVWAAALYCYLLFSFEFCTEWVTIELPPLEHGLDLLFSFEFCEQIERLSAVLGVNLSLLFSFEFCD